MDRRSNGRCDGRMDGRTVGRTNARTDGRTEMEREAGEQTGVQMCRWCTEKHVNPKQKDYNKYAIHSAHRVYPPLSYVMGTSLGRMMDLCVPNGGRPYHRRESDVHHNQENISIMRTQARPGQTAASRTWPDILCYEGIGKTQKYNRCKILSQVCTPQKICKTEYYISQILGHSHLSGFCRQVASVTVS